MLEAHTGKRPEDASRVLAPMYEELVGRGFVGGDSLARKYEAAISRPTSTRDGLLVDFAERIERGHKAWIAGSFQDAVATLVPAIEAARANPGAFAQNQVLHDRLLKGLIALALSQHRSGDPAAARATLAEIVRSYPDTQVSRAQYGPDAYALFEQVRRSVGDRGRGRLIVTARHEPESAVVFVNERFQQVGTLSKGDLVPGDYRVFIQLGKQQSRAHRVAVRANADTRLVIDRRYDASVHTSNGWTGLLFQTSAERTQHESQHAAMFAKHVGATAVVVVGIDQVQGRPALVGALVDLGTGREIRRASLALDPDPPSERVRSLARFLAGDEPEEGIVIELREVAPASAGDGDGARRPADSGRRAGTGLRWGGYAALAVGAVGFGAGLKFGLDMRARDGDLQEICAVSCTSDQALRLEAARDQAGNRALIATAIGGAAVVTGVVLLVLARSRGDVPAVTVAPVEGGAIASYAFSM